MKQSQFPSGTPGANDVFPFVHDPTGTPSNKNVKLSDLGSAVSPYVGSSGISWTLVNNEDGSSLSNFYTTDGTGVSFSDTGTWSVSGGAIKQSASNGAWHMAVPNTVLSPLTSVWATSVQIKCLGGWGAYAGLAPTSKFLHTDGSPVNRWQPFVYINMGEDVATYSISLQSAFSGGGAERSFSTGVARDTNYHTLSLLGSSGTISIWWDGVFITNFTSQMADGGYPASWDRVALVSYQGNVGDHAPPRALFQKL